MNAEEIREELVKKSRQAFGEGLFTGTSGNMSYFDRDRGVVYITPTSLRYDEMMPKDIVEIDLGGNILSGIRKPSSEWRLHTVVYSAFPEVNSVFHTHSPCAAAYAACRMNIPPVLIEAHMFLGGDIRCAAYAEPGSEDVGRNAVPALNGRGGCILANHGTVAVGKDISEAYIRAEYIEELAKVNILASAVGNPVILEAL